MGDVNPIPEAPRPRRRRVLPRAVMISLVVVAAGVAILAGRWLTLTREGQDAQLLSLERSVRYARWRFGLPLAGEPDLSNLTGRLAEKGMQQGSPVLVRIFKREFELELWMARDGVFERLSTYPICRWSGALGPKVKTGDRQAPEGFYAVTKEQLNPNSRWYRSFNIGFPNAYDRALGRTGSFLMVHGGCGSVGCYAMTNAQMDEIWRLVTAALDAGQGAFQVQIYPFRMSQDNLAAYADDERMAFWRDLAAGNELFESSRLPPQVNLCRGRYAFQAGTGTSNVAPAMGVSCPQTSAKN